MRDNITAAREQTARTLATRELARLTVVYRCSSEEYERASAQAASELTAPDGPLDPLCAAYEAKLAEVTRERDEARAKALDARLEVIAFARLMEAKLRENEHKGGWNPRTVPDHVRFR